MDCLPGNPLQAHTSHMQGALSARSTDNDVLVVDLINSAGMSVTDPRGTLRVLGKWFSWDGLIRFVATIRPRCGLLERITSKAWECFRAKKIRTILRSQETFTRDVQPEDATEIHQYAKEEPLLDYGVCA